MFSRLVKVQLAVFTALTVLCVTTVATNYLNWGTSQYTVFADFADASGLYPEASVTYLGVDVGRVASLELDDDGVRAALALNEGTRIPGGVRAEIHSTSAVGEQYVELAPEGVSSTSLVGGSVIPRSRTKSLSSTAELLTSLDRLSASIPGDKLRIVLAEVTTAFQNSGGELGSLLDSSALLLHEAAANIGPTTRLLGELGPVLDTQHDLDGDLRSFTRDLASFTDQLRYSDGDLRTLFDSGPPLRAAFVGIEDKLHQTLPILLGNLVSTGQVVRTYLPGVEQVLVLYPALTAAIQSSLLPYTDIGAIGNVLRLNVNDPPPCTKGYLPNQQRRDPVDTGQVATPTDLYCKVASRDPRVVRGARNTPCLNAPGRRAASPSECLGGPPDVPTPYNSTTGQFLSPNGGLYLLGEHQEEDLRWQKLMVK